MAGKRKRGEGTVRLRKDGRWEGRVVVGYDEAGNPKTKNVLAKTKKACVEKLEKLKEQGNHTELIAKKGAYFNLVKDQLELGN